MIQPFLAAASRLPVGDRFAAIDGGSARDQRGDPDLVGRLGEGEHAFVVNVKFGSPDKCFVVAPLDVTGRAFPCRTARSGVRRRTIATSCHAGTRASGGRGRHCCSRTCCCFWLFGFRTDARGTTSHPANGARPYSFAVGQAAHRGRVNVPLAGRKARSN